MGSVSRDRSGPQAWPNDRYAFPGPVVVACCQPDRARCRCYHDKSNDDGRTPEGVSEEVEPDPGAVVESSRENIDTEGGNGPSVIALILVAVLLLLLLGVITMAKITRGRRDTPEPDPPQPENENPPPDSAPSSAEPEPVAEEHIADLFGDMATGEIGKLPPVSPPTGRLRPGWE